MADLHYGSPSLWWAVTTVCTVHTVSAKIYKLLTMISLLLLLYYNLLFVDYYLLLIFWNENIKTLFLSLLISLCEVLFVICVSWIFTFVSIKWCCVVLFDAFVGRHEAVLCLHQANLSTPMDWVTSCGLSAHLLSRHLSVFRRQHSHCGLVVLIWSECQTCQYQLIPDS